MTTTPRPATGDEVARIETGRHYDETDWTRQADGSWWLVHEGGADTVANWREFERIKMSTRRWAKRHGYRRETRRRDRGRLIWVRLSKTD